MPVKSKSRTFKPGDNFSDAFKFFDKEMDGVLEWAKKRDPTDDEYVFKKKVVITITYERDDKTE